MGGGGEELCTSCTPHERGEGGEKNCVRHVHHTRGGRRRIVAGLISVESLGSSANAQTYM